VVEVEVRRDGRQRLSSLFARGHAGWAESGSDIVCAAVSAIIQAGWLGIEQVATVQLEVERDADHLSLRWPPDARDNDALVTIVRTVELSVEQLARQYPDHVRLARETEP
jgi:uncharacterized protein YsxB (DUF464 family)